MRSALLAIVAVVSFSGRCLGTEVWIETVRDGVSHFGTGVVVGFDGRSCDVIVTVAHMFGETGDKATVQGKRVRRIFRDPRSDIAILLCDRTGFSSSPLADSLPEAGEEVTLGGLVSGRRRGRLLYQARWDRTPIDPGQPTLVFSGGSRYGNSGGAVYDRRGRLVGILTNGETRAYATPIGYAVRVAESSGEVPLEVFLPCKSCVIEGEAPPADPSLLP
jgi:S1-C subfamily serine protease